MNEFTEDAFLGGKFYLKQPKAGFRAGTDSILLAASIEADGESSILDLGCGPGAVLAAMACRLGAKNLYGIDIEPRSLELAKTNAQKQNQAWTLVEGNALFPNNSPDIMALEQKMNFVTLNPPYYSAETHTAALDSVRSKARTLEQETSLKDWFKSAAFFLKDKGWLHVVLPTFCLDQALLAAQKRHFGHIQIFPLWPKSNTPSKRLLLRFQKNSKVPLRLLSGLTVHQENGELTPKAHALLWQGNALNWQS